MKNRHSEYMNWAKLCSKAPYNLATSGVGPFPLRELNFDREQLEINGPSTYGYEPLRQAIGSQYGVGPESVVTTAGTSMANHLAMAALVEEGDEVLVEQPAYELLTATALYFTSNIKRFIRREENGYALDPAEVERAVTPKTRLIVITNLHNPSSVLAGEQELLAVGAIAQRVGARVLVDEVYLDAVYEATPRSSIHYGPQFVVTNSLTKVYGLSGLRCGWILAEPELALDMWRLNDLFGSVAPFPTEQLSVAAFAQLDAIRERSRRVVEADRKQLSEFLYKLPDMHTVRTDWGTTCFIKADDESFVDRLRRDYETSVVPGRFFDKPQHFRIGMGVDNATFAEGLRRIEKAW